MAAAGSSDAELATAERLGFAVQRPFVGRAQWRTPEDVKASYPKASILKGSRVVFNLKGNDYRLIASVPVSGRRVGNSYSLNLACWIRQDRCGESVMDATLV